MPEVFSTPDPSKGNPPVTTTPAPASGLGRAASKVGNGIVKTTWMVGGIVWALIGFLVLISGSGWTQLVGLPVMAYGVWLVTGALRGGWRVLIW